MTKAITAGLLAFGLLACAGSGPKSLAAKGGAASDAQPSGASSAPTARTLSVGTAVAATIQDAISSRTNSVGEHVNAIVSRDVMDDGGHVVIPGGSAIVLTIAKLGPAKNSGEADGMIALDVSSLTVGGTTYEPSATVGSVPHTLKGRGVTKSAVGNVAVGTAAGAVIGQVIGKNEKSTIIGGAIGAVAGGARAATLADRDVIVTPGTPITITLTQSLKISAN